MSLSDILYGCLSKEICEIDPNGVYALSFYVQDKKANPEGVADEFVNWITGMY